MTEGIFEEKQYVVFRLGEEVFGVEINLVKEIIPQKDGTKIPGSGECIEGVINLRGSVIPIYSLKKKFGFGEVKVNNEGRIMVVESGNNTIGVIVDAVSEVLVIPGAVIETPSSVISAGVDAKFVKGIAKMEAGLIIILNLDEVIAQQAVS